MLINVTLTSSA